jgi:flagellar biosynthetic protein FlhB
MAGHDERTEQPTQRKLQKAREHGQFLTAREFVGAVQFLAFAAVIAFLGPDWIDEVKAAFRASLRAAFDRSLEAADAVALLRGMLTRAAAPVAGVAAALAVIALGTQLAISGMGVSWQKLSPSIARMNPVTRLRELAGQAAGLAVHTVVVLAAITAIVWSMISGLLPAMVELPLATLQAALARTGAFTISLLWKCAAILILFGAVDLFRQKRKLGKQLRMTKQEVRDELKESEGNMQIKARIRRLRADLLRRRMMSQIPHATAVIVNPTHYAVALKYDPETMPSPIVVAKGKNYLALRIREKAVAHHVPIVENPPLARVMYQSVEVGQQIPVEFYRAVAEILAYLYRMMNQR